MKLSLHWLSEAIDDFVGEFLSFIGQRVKRNEGNENYLIIFLGAATFRALCDYETTFFKLN